MDETTWLLQQYEMVAGLYKHTQEIRQSRINWGLALQGGLFATVGAFGEHMAVAIAASVAGAGLAAALFLMVGRHTEVVNLWAAQLREIEKRIMHLAPGFVRPPTPFSAEQLAFGPRAVGVRFASTGEQVRTRWWSSVSANRAEKGLMVCLAIGWLALLALFLVGVVEIGGDAWCAR
jgi:hypothetical protein